MRNIGKIIKERRIELGLSQDELAKKVGYKSRTSICKIESNRDVPIYKIDTVAKALGIDTSELFGWSNASIDMERNLIQCFRQLSDENKELIIKTVEAMRKTNDN